MSQSNSNAPVISEPLKAQSVDDIFGKLSEGDELESLDLNKPIGDKSAGKEKDGKTVDDVPDEKVEIEDKEVTDDEKENEEIDELEQIEEDLKEIDEEKLELKTPVARREILKKYPNLFKDFPYLEAAYYREQQFTEIHGTIEDAKEAAESHRVLARYTEDMVEKGNVNNVLKMIREHNPETFAQVVDGYMEHLRTVDEGAHNLVTSNIVKNIILGMVEEAKSSNDDDLRTAALLLNKYAFGSSRFTPPQKMSKEVKSEDKTKEAEITKREQEFEQRRLDSAVGEANTRVNNAIRGAIEKNIDPNGSMTDYVKRNAIRDATEKINNLIKKDQRFSKVVDQLWDRARTANYSEDSTDAIRKAFLAKARSLLAPVIQSARKEALRGMGKKVKDAEEQVEETEQPERQRSGRQTERRPSSEDKNRAKLDSMRGSSSFDKLNALMGD